MKNISVLRVTLFLAAVAGLFGALNADWSSSQTMTLSTAGTPAPRDAGGSLATEPRGALQSLDSASDWINTPALISTELRGKVVLINFWTYSCINWMRQLPHVRAWAERYTDHGLVVVGVHTPEFSFESDIVNVRKAAGDLNVGFPIAVDSDRAIWQAFHNEYWPALYLIDAQGRIRYVKTGEGDYERSEEMIRALLEESGRRSLPDARPSVPGAGVEAPADWRSLKSPETYVGYAQVRNFASPGGPSPNQSRTYVSPNTLRGNQWALTGQWTIGKESALLNQPDGRVVFRFHARDLHLVMGPRQRGSPVRFRVLLDGKAPGAGHGLDIDSQGYGTAVTQRMYQLLRQPHPIASRLFEIEFLDPGMEVFAFTFG